MLKMFVNFVFSKSDLENKREQFSDIVCIPSKVKALREWYFWQPATLELSQVAPSQIRLKTNQNSELKT